MEVFRNMKKRILNRFFALVLSFVLLVSILDVLFLRMYVANHPNVPVLGPRQE